MSTISYDEKPLPPGVQHHPSVGIVSGCTCEECSTKLSLWVQWRDVADPETVLCYDQAFIRRVISWAPYWRRQIKDETRELARALLRLHLFGSFPYASELATALSTPYTKKIGDRELWAMRRQRPYLSFAIPQQEGLTADILTLERFTDSLLNDEEIYAMVSYYSGYYADDDDIQRCSTTSLI